MSLWWFDRLADGEDTPDTRSYSTISVAATQRVGAFPTTHTLTRVMVLAKDIIKEGTRPREPTVRCPEGSCDVFEQHMTSLRFSRIPILEPRTT